MVEAYTQIFCINNEFMFYFPVNKDDLELAKKSHSSLVFTRLPQSSAQLHVDTHSERRQAWKGPGKDCLPQGQSFGEHTRCREQLL